MAPRAGQGRALKRAALLALVLILACSPTLDRQRWQKMPAGEKRIYVSSLLGHEKAKQAKGGNDKVFALSAGEYVKRIDDAYARGDVRDPGEIFEALATTAAPSTSPSGS